MRFGEICVPRILNFALYLEFLICLVELNPIYVGEDFKQPLKQQLLIGLSCILLCSVNTP